MNRLFRCIACSCMLLANLIPAALEAQETDHLSMQLAFQDSILRVEASYTSASGNDGNLAYFILNPGIKPDTVVSHGLLSYSLVQREGTPFPMWELRFAEGSDASEREVAFTYRINLKRQNHLQSDWIELNADKMWFPNKGKLNNAFTYDLAIRDFPEDFHLITHADATISRDGRQIRIQKDTPWFEVLLLGGRDMKTWEFDEQITLVGSRSIPDSTYRSLGVKVANSIDTLNDYFGVTDTIASFRVILRNTSREELGFQFNRGALIVTGTDFNDYGNLSHEIAHYWWSDADFIQEPWLNESFANFGMYLVLREYEPAAYLQLLSKHKKIAEDAIPVADAQLFEADAYPSYYHKGAVLLTRLEEKIGAQKMRELLRAFLGSDHRTTEEFLQLLEEYSGSPARGYFEGLLGQ